MDVWINGTWVKAEDARISIFDAGVQHGVGLFETMGARHGRVFRAQQHMELLRDSARELMLTERLHVEPLVEAVHAAVARNDFSDSRVRITLTGGDLAKLPSTGRSNVDPSIIIVAQPPTPYPEDFFTKGIIATVVDGRLNPFEMTAGHKTMNYWSRIQALQVAAARGAGEALWFSVSNHLACGSVSNAFIIRDGVLITPVARGEEDEESIPSVVRPGVTRAVMFECAAKLNMKIERRYVTIEDILGADEAFLTNSSWGVLPLVGLEKETIGDGEVGEMTQQLRESWLHVVEEETAAAAEA